ncbi:MAG: hypothetical protein SGJ09_13330 [Phycisphaerae bacterium]|mgnify:CR=1 FL=1|nr:hypothetical protein [Phycisphaerae bacterium]
MPRSSDDFDPPNHSLRLHRELGDAASRGPQIPDDIDAAIRSAIARQFQASTPVRRVTAWWLVAGAIAAVLFAAVGTAIWSAGRTALVPSQADGRMTIAAALREVERISPNSSQRAKAISDPRVRAILMAIVAISGTSGDAKPLAIAPHASFVVYDIMIDTEVQALAAWQCELSLPGRIAGIEGGDGPFSAPATYDRAALVTGRVMLAAIADGAAATGSMRVGSVTVQFDSEAPPPSITLSLACGRGAELIPARFQLLPRTP